MDITKKKVGIWGYGITGKAAIPFFKQLSCELGLIEKRTLTTEEQQQITNDGITLWPYDQLEQFLQAHDYILTSGSIDLRPFAQFQHKWLAEVDLIQHFAKDGLGNPTVIAITGTVGKTTITRLLAHTLTHAGYRVKTGGNIGLGMLALLTDGTPCDYLILELSSYQLELSKTFAPDVAVWTNFYPNHLDRHGSEQAYFNAKAKLFAFQTVQQHAIVSAELSDHVHMNAKKHIAITDAQATSTITYPDNIAILEAILATLNLDPQLLPQASATFERDGHRLEKVGTINGIDVYNDSKSTVPQATIAAVRALQSKPIILLLGGVSKGVDRSSLLNTIQASTKPQCIKAVICFGAEAQQLQQAVSLAGVPGFISPTLEDAWLQALKLAQPGDQVLLSPAGASYDLFTDYQERGNVFKKLVNQYQKLKGLL